MILSLHISKIESGRYRAAVLAGSEEMDEWGASSIGDAICQCSQAQMPNLLGFHIWYEHVCAGTVSMADMRMDPERIAQRLVTLHGSIKD